MKTLIRHLVLFVAALSILSCGNNLPVVTDLSNQSYTLLTQDSTAIRFPEFVKGKLVVMGFIFTNCPSICPLTTNNMRLIHERLNSENIQNVELVSLTFDPDADTPGILKKYAELRNLDTKNWTFLTGRKSTIDSLIKAASVLAIPDTTTTPTGKEFVNYIHTDRISLIDEQGRIRKEYPGSTINIEEIVNDIKNY